MLVGRCCRAWPDNCRPDPGWSFPFFGPQERNVSEYVCLRETRRKKLATTKRSYFDCSQKTVEFLGYGKLIILLLLRSRDRFWKIIAVDGAIPHAPLERIDLLAELAPVEMHHAQLP